MARPSRNNAEYFYHSANFRNDRRVRAIRARFGIAGYGLLLMLMEALTDSDYTQLSTDEMEMELLAGDFGVSVTEIDSLLQICEKVGLFCRNNDGNLISPELNESLKAVFDKRNRSREAFEKSKEDVSATETPDSVTESTRSKEKRSKRKRDTQKGYTPEYENFWKLYAKPTADKKQAFAEWCKLKPDEQASALAVIPAYLTIQPEARYRKDPERFFKSRMWENDFTPPGTTATPHVKKMVM